jgi:hypothetical protein
MIPYALHQVRGRDLSSLIGLSRGELNLRLAKHGFPRLGEVRDWILLLYLLSESQRSFDGLLRIAARSNIDLSVCHRAIHRVTGLTWSEAKTRDLDHWLMAFRERVGDRLLCGQRTRESGHSEDEETPGSQGSR